jgi:hypothetical protein
MAARRQVANKQVAAATFQRRRQGAEHLAEAGISASVGSVGDSFDNALAETINGLYKTDLIKHRARGGPSSRSSMPPPNGSIGSITDGSTSTADTFRQQNWRTPTTVKPSPAFRSGAQKQSDRTRRGDSILQDGDYRVKAFDASQIQRIDQIAAAGELSEAAMRLRQPCGSGRAGARAFRALQAPLRFAAYPR